MVKRIITAAVSLCILAPFLLFSHTFMLLIFSGGLTLIALYEMFDCIGCLRRPSVIIPAALLTILSVLTTRAFPTDRYFALLFMSFFVYLIYLLTSAVFSRGDFSVKDAALVAVTTVYIVFGFSSVILLRDVNYGNYVFLFPFLVAWLTDSGAYFIGVNFGKHKLIPEVSPKKTVEGAVGGIVFGTLSPIILGWIITNLAAPGLNANYGALLIGGFVMSIIAQCGDLIASLIKRHYNIKDYGFLFPGHGGVIDRFDSILVTMPFLYFLYLLFPSFQMFYI